MKSKHTKRVAITGIGAVTALGHDFNSTWQSVKDGKVAAAPITRFKSGAMPTGFAYEVKDFKIDLSSFSEQEQKSFSYITEFAYGACKEALTQAGLWGDQSYKQTEKSVCFGIRPASPTFDWYRKHFVGESPSPAPLENFSLYNPLQMLQFIADSCNARGGNMAVQTACASSGQSIGEAFQLIASGRRKMVVTGGVDSMIEPFSVAGFNLLGALSTSNEQPQQASRPFDIDRNGFVLGEGAASLVIEEWESAEARGAKVLGEIVGYGVTESAYRITDLNPEGRGPIEAMQLALDHADIESQQVGYVNAHGTSTHLNDKVESLCIEKVFGSDTYVSSTKSMTGHMIAAAGGMEFLFCVAALKEQMLPPTVNCFKQDPQCNIKLTDDKPTPHTFEYALSNSVGFGGSNTSLIARRVEA